MRSASTPSGLGPFFTPLLLTIAACQPPSAEAEGGPKTGVKEREIPIVRVASVERRDMVRVLEATSKLESDREVPLFAELPGTAIEILAEEGDVVTAGQVLARLDDRDEQLAARDAAVALAEAKDSLVLAELAVEEGASLLEDAAAGARQAERDYDRDERLARSTSLANPLSAQAVEARLLERDQRRNAEKQAEIALRRRTLEVQTARTSIARAEVALERSALDLSKKEIRAPFDGIVSRRNIRIGKSVGAGEAAFVLTDIRNVRANFMRPQEELGLFSELQGGAANGTQPAFTLTATAEAYPGRAFSGWIERISPTIDADSGQFRVVARLRPADNADDGGARDTTGAGVLLPGMLIRMRIVTDRHDGTLTVPKRALRREGDRRFVLLARTRDGETVLERIDVDEGYEDEEFVEILPREDDAIGAGDLVVDIGTRDLEDGDPVRIESAAAPADAGAEDAPLEGDGALSEAASGEMDDAPATSDDDASTEADS